MGWAAALSVRLLSYPCWTDTQSYHTDVVSPAREPRLWRTEARGHSTTVWADRV
jgi:uncharacterized protein YaeQ